MGNAKLFISVVISLACAICIGEMLSVALRFVLPDSINLIVWVIDGMATAYVYFIFSSVGAAFAYGEEENPDYVKRAKKLKWVMVPVVLLTSSITLGNSVVTNNEKWMIVSASMIGLTLILLLFDFAKSNRVKVPKEIIISGNRLPKKVRLHGESDHSILDALYLNRLSEISDKKPADWRERQAQAMQSLWLDAIRDSYSVNSKTIDDHAKYIMLLTEEVLMPPGNMDTNEYLHYKFAQDVSFAYSDFLAYKNETTYPKCRIRPESVLPLPKLVIYNACNYFSMCIENGLFDSAKFISSHSQSINNSDSMSVTLRAISVGLDTNIMYLPLDETEVPSDPTENRAFYLSYLRGIASETKSQ